jgi:hypothetical protein
VQVCSVQQWCHVGCRRIQVNRGCARTSGSTMAKVCSITSRFHSLDQSVHMQRQPSALRPAPGGADKVIGVQHYSDGTDDPACSPQEPPTGRSFRLLPVLVLLALRTACSQELAMTVRFTPPLPLDHLVHSPFRPSKCIRTAPTCWQNQEARSLSRRWPTSRSRSCSRSHSSAPDACLRPTPRAAPHALTCSRQGAGPARC